VGKIVGIGGRSIGAVARTRGNVASITIYIYIVVVHLGMGPSSLAWC
jgi:hypothetical protein